MSYRTREQKREEKILHRRVKKAHGDRETKARHFLTIAKCKAKCERCPHRALAGDEFVYRHEPRQVLCVDCANLAGVKWRTSWRWEKAQAKRRHARPDRATAKSTASRYSPQELLAELVIEAGRSTRGGFTRSMTERWGLLWPLPTGWRRELRERWAGPSKPPPLSDLLRA
jgi:hypothetical protein